MAKGKCTSTCGKRKNKSVKRITNIASKKIKKAATKLKKQVAIQKIEEDQQHQRERALREHVTRAGHDDYSNDDDDYEKMFDNKKSEDAVDRKRLKEKNKRLIYRYYKHKTMKEIAEDHVDRDPEPDEILNLLRASSEDVTDDSCSSWYSTESLEGDDN